MSFVANQKQTYLRLLEKIRPHCRDDFRLPDRIQKLLSRDKRFGSKDRRLYRELLYTSLRFLPWIEPLLASDPDRAAAMVAWLAADLPSTHLYRSELLADWPPSPDTLSEKADLLNLDPSTLLPTWLREECPEAFNPDELDCLHRRASLWLRLQTRDAKLLTDECDQRGWTWRQSDLLPDAIEILSEADATQTDAYRHGAFEIQDLGSQLILNTAAITPGGQWLDACAGAGGKSLQLDRLLGPSGHVTAHDIRPHALRELNHRAQRSHLRNISTTTTLGNAHYDGILIDAPCSGSGTWRRAPHLKAVTTPKLIADYAARQLELLEHYAPLLRPDGQLIYATCSLNRSENEHVVAEFLSQYPDFSVIPPKRAFGYLSGPHGLLILPSRHNTDGFFTAILARV